MSEWMVAPYMLELCGWGAGLGQDVKMSSAQGTLNQKCWGDMQVELMSGHEPAWVQGV